MLVINWFQMKPQCNDDAVYQPVDWVEVGVERPLGERPGEQPPSWNETWNPSAKPRRPPGPTVLHRLAVNDYDQLERRADEINEENINSKCGYPGVSQTLLLGQVDFSFPVTGVYRCSFLYDFFLSCLIFSTSYQWKSFFSYNHPLWTTRRIFRLKTCSVH